jgi:hypothetical protein
MRHLAIISFVKGQSQPKNRNTSGIQRWNKCQLDLSVTNEKKLKHLYLDYVVFIADNDPSTLATC